MTDINALIARNKDRWRSAKLTRGPEFSSVARRLVYAKARYQAVSARTGVPWFVIAVIHEREAGQDWTKQLGQGDPLNEVSRHVPSGRGPFSTWEDGAYDALVNCPPRLALWKDWSSGGTITAVTLYNGLIYDEHNRPSPYAWAGTTIYDPPTGPGGKVLVDHGPIEDVVDRQLGCAGLIIAMKQIDPYISFAGETGYHVPPPPDIHPVPQQPQPSQNIFAALIDFIISLFRRK